MNAINVISPYRWNDLWVFDDPEKGLNKEPLIAGIDTMLDYVSREANGQAFNIVFSATEFPDHQVCLNWVRAGDGGNWYEENGTLNIEGWLCPALLKYFEQAPKQIYIQVKPKDSAGVKLIGASYKKPAGLRLCRGV
jgi:Family of unknown function (DUF6717)